MDLGLRRKKQYTIENLTMFKEQCWSWSQKFDYLSILENNLIEYPHSPFPNILAAGALKVFKSTTDDSFNELKTFYNQNKEWVFGFFTYDLKNEIEALQSAHPDFQQSEKILFFIPEHLIFFDKEKVTISSFKDPDQIFKEIINCASDFPPILPQQSMSFKTINQKEYIEKVNQIKEHIIKGDVYELNYCFEFSSEQAHLQPLYAFKKLIGKSPMPFSCLVKAKENYIICSSPERFLKKEGKTLISQPIKGTRRRGGTIDEDEELKNELKTSEKELSENLMIVDLVRNDLARTSVPGSVKVDEIFGIYTFQQLHQMISTIISTKRPRVHFIDVIKNAFPMGSMTGAPKIKSMELIEKYESSKRGMFSGAAGYIAPQGDFDFNVIIRSIFYNSLLKRISFQVGSAITYDSIPEEEYMECLLKAKAIIEVLGKEYLFEEFVECN